MQQEFVYLFLTDLVRTPFHNYKSYVETEPGYGACMLQAYITAFSQDTKGLMNEELIHSIHKEAMRFKPDSIIGQFRIDHNHLSIYPHKINEALNPSYSVTKEGLKEFIDYWFNNTNVPFHSFCFTNTSTKIHAEEFLFSPNPGKKEMIVYSTDAYGVRNKPQVISYTQTERKIYNLLNQFKYCCDINFFCDNSQSEVQELTSKRIKIIINEFNEEIIKAQNSEEKIKIIAKHIQRIDQVHPYVDGNIRTCYILMNKLLKDHGLSLTLLMNPNRLDACSLEQLVQMIKQGQIHYQQLIQHKDGKLKLTADHEINEISKSITCEPQQLFDISKELVSDFIECVIEGKPKQKVSLQNNRYSFVASSTKAPNALPDGELPAANIVNGPQAS